MKRRYFKNAVLFFAAMFLLFSPPAHAGRIAEREILPNGIILLRSEKNALPMVTVVVAVKAGSIFEPSEKAGLANLTADLLNEGTKRRTAGEISEEIEFVGGTLTASGGYDFITIKLTVLKKDIELGFDLISDIILNPLFSPDEISRRKTMIRNAIIRQNEEPGLVASKAFLKAVYGDHPYGRMIEGTEETLDNITREDLVAFHEKYYAPNNSIMAVVGDINKDELMTLLNRYFKDWRPRGIKTEIPPVPEFNRKRRVIRINRNITQANIILGHPGIKRDSPDYYAVSVMNYILGGGGFASRLMDNIRDDKGLAYDIYSYFFANKYAGSFRVELQTKNRSANTAIDEVLKEMNRIRTEPVSRNELSDAKSYMTGSFPLRLDSNNKMAGFLIATEYYGLGLDYAENYRKFINAVSTQDILEAARKHLDTENYILVVVGDIKKTELRY